MESEVRKAGLFRDDTLLQEFEGKTCLLEAQCVKDFMASINRRSGYTVKYI